MPSDSRSNAPATSGTAPPAGASFTPEQDPALRTGGEAGAATRSFAPGGEADAFERGGEADGDAEGAKQSGGTERSRMPPVIAQAGETAEPKLADPRPAPVLTRRISQGRPTYAEADPTIAGTVGRVARGANHSLPPVDGGVT